MKKAIIGLCLLGTPALAHHEVVVATSMIPFLGGLAVIAAAIIAAWRDKK